MHPVEMAAVAGVLLVSAVLNAVLAVAYESVDTVPDYASFGPLWSAYVLSSDGTPRIDLSAWRRDFNPLLDLDPVELSRYWGYNAELHHVTTDDGYILGIHRITGPSRGARTSESGNELGRGRGQQRPVVIMAHPLLPCSAEWIVLGPGKALAYLLADEGFDVWLFNARGNTYSLNHTTLDTKSAAFWDFSFHEHGTQDLPALIQYAMRETGERRVQYVGFSMGTTMMFVMAAERPDVARHVQLFTGFGPVMHVMNVRSALFRLVLQTNPTRMRNAAAHGVYWLLPTSAAIRTAGEIFCSDGSPTQPLCVLLINAMSGRNDKQSNPSLLPYAISRTPAGTSYKNIGHYGQSHVQGFQQYDYGTAENLARYGQERPPRYNVSNIVVPSRLYYGMNDLLAVPRDVEPLCAALPNVLSCDAVADPLWTHLNFVWSKEAPELVYKRAIADMKEAVLSTNGYS
ncbi:lipase 3-like isoform X2 [Frankliniella occidentalis]|nr:lipase 3-like isoform X2 [Frankliniella occidentalis]XP_026279854.1 lipase 3-like isoform X2 [Frankliniella occidentalis]XP_026279861.1 lipase 3-like isoform X2 [Frankliniella occidentalis]